MEGLQNARRSVRAQVFRVKWFPKITANSAGTRSFATGLVLAIGTLCAFAQELRPLPPALYTLSDEVGAVSVEEGIALSRSAEEISDRTGVRVIVVIVETTLPEQIEDYTERLAQRWKRDRRLEPERSIFVVLVVGDRELQIMPGKDLLFVDLELKKPEMYAGLTALLRERRYFEALMKVNSRLLEMLLKQKSRS